VQSEASAVEQLEHRTDQEGDEEPDAEVGPVQPRAVHADERVDAIREQARHRVVLVSHKMPSSELRARKSPRSTMSVASRLRFSIGRTRTRSVTAPRVKPAIVAMSRHSTTGMFLVVSPRRCRW